MTKVEEALEEIDAELERLKPVREGFADYARLDLQPETKSYVKETLRDIDRRVTELEAAKKALEALMAGGYPDLEIAPASQEVYDDLANNHDTLGAALGEVEVKGEPVAESVSIEWDKPVEQE